MSASQDHTELGLSMHGIWTCYLKTNIVFCCCFYRRSYTVLLPAYRHRSIPNWWNCGPPTHPSLYSLVQSPPKCKVLFCITSSSMLPSFEIESVGGIMPVSRIDSVCVVANLRYDLETPNGKERVTVAVPLGVKLKSQYHIKL